MRYQLINKTRLDNNNTLYNVFRWYEMGHVAEARKLLIQLYSTRFINTCDKYHARALFYLTKTTKQLFYAVECFQNARLFSCLSDTQQGELLLYITQAGIVQHKSLDNIQELKQLAKYLIAFLKTKYFKTSLDIGLQKSYIAAILTSLKKMALKGLNQPELQNLGYDLLHEIRCLSTTKSPHAVPISSVGLFDFKHPLPRVREKYKKVKRLKAVYKRPVFQRQDSIRFK